MDEKVERLKKAFEYLRYKRIVKTQKDLAERMNSAIANVSRAFNGDTKYLTNGFLVRFNMSVGDIFNEEWLLTGRGNMINGVLDNPNSIFKNLVSAIQAKYNLSQKEIREKIGLNDLDFSIMMSETLPFDQLTAKKFSEAFPNLNKQYLEMGKGEIFLEEEKVVSCSDKSSDVVTMSREVFELLKKQSETILSQQRTIEMMQAGQHSIKDCKKTAN